VVGNEFNNIPGFSEGLQEYITSPVPLTFNTLHFDYGFVAEHILKEIVQRMGRADETKYMWVLSFNQRE